MTTIFQEKYDGWVGAAIQYSTLVLTRWVAVDLWTHCNIGLFRFGGVITKKPFCNVPKWMQYRLSEPIKLITVILKVQKGTRKWHISLKSWCGLVAKNNFQVPILQLDSYIIILQTSVAVVSYSPSNNNAVISSQQNICPNSYSLVLVVFVKQLLCHKTRLTTT